MMTLSLMVSLLSIVHPFATPIFVTLVRLIPEASKLQIRSPRPVVLDTYLRLRADCKLLKIYRDGKGQQPWVFCGSDPESASPERNARKSALEAAGAVVYEIPRVSGTAFCIPRRVFSIKM